MSSSCDVCRERSVWAVVLEEPEQHEPIAPGGLRPDPWSCRLACRECATTPPWTEVHIIRPDLRASLRRKAFASRLGAGLLGFMVGTALVSAVGGSTIVDVAQGSELIELPAPSVEDKLRDQLGLERDRASARINNLTDTNRALRTQLRIERRVKAWDGRDLVAESRLAIRTMARVYGVPERVALCLGRGESGHRPWATNGQFIGLFQLGRNFYPGPFLPTREAAFHPWLNAAAALSVVAVQGDRQWEVSALTCRAKPGYPANSAGWRP